MLAVDTNVVVRLVTNDDPVQAQRALRAFSQNSIFLGKTVLLELEWVLRYSYELERDVILRTMRGVLGLQNVQMEDADNVARALPMYEAGMDFADALHLVSCGPAQRFGTFDSKLARDAKPYRVVQVVAL